MSCIDSLKAAGLERLAAIIEANGREAIRFRTLPMDEDDFAVGQTKIGGFPHMPADMEWPRYKGSPLYFLAQINLKDLPDCAAARLLPDTGMLYFFHEGHSVWGFDPGDAGGFRVFHVEDGMPLVPRKPGNDEECTFDGTCAAQFEAETEYPASVELLDGLGLLEGFSEEEQEKLFDVLSEGCGDFEEDGEHDEVDFEVEDGNDPDEDDFDDEPRHKLLGWPDLIQGDIFQECQLASNGIYCGNGDGYESEKNGVLQGIRDWTLLFQLDSDDDAGMMWGDVGRLYFCIRKDDLKKRSFDKIWAVLQCY